MKVLKVQWNAWAAKFSALSLRERSIVAGAMVLGGGLLLFNFGVEPLQLRAKLATRAVVSAQTELSQQQALLTTLTTQNVDPDTSNRQRLAQIRQQLETANTHLVQFEAGMVPSSRMQVFLEGLLARNRNVELLGLKTLPATPLGGLAATGKPETGALTVAPKNAPSLNTAPVEAIYLHGVEIRLAGSYNDLLNYLVDLEHMPQRVMWHSVSLTVKKYPRNELVLRVYTLSLDSNWLVV